MLLFYSRAVTPNQYILLLDEGHILCPAEYASAQQVRPSTLSISTSTITITYCDMGVPTALFMEANNGDLCEKKQELQYF